MQPLRPPLSGAAPSTALVTEEEEPPCTLDHEAEPPSGPGTAPSEAWDRDVLNEAIVGNLKETLVCKPLLVPCVATSY